MRPKLTAMNTAISPVLHESSFPDDGTAVLAANPILGLTDTDAVVWRMRPDEKRVLLYKLDKDTMNVVEIHKLHPSAAIVLALLQGRPYREGRDRAAVLFRKSAEELDAWYARQLATWFHRGAFEVKQPGQRVEPLDPATLAIPAEGADVKRWWLYRPINVTIKVTDSCQRDCRYCSVERRKDHPSFSTETWLRVLEDAVDSGVVSVTLVGGDPLLHHGLPDMIRYLTGRGVHPFISTKVFISEAKAEELRAAGLERIQISIDSEVEAIEDFMVASSGAAPQLFASLANCQRAGLRVGTNSVITPYNVLLFPTLVRRLHALGVTTMRTSQCGYSIFAENIEPFLLREQEARWLENEVRQLQREGIGTRFSYATVADRRERFRSRAFCTAGAWAMIINSNGSVVLCDDLPGKEPFVVGNVLDAKLLDIWNGEAANAFRRPERAWFDGTACGDCPDFAACSDFPRICFRDAYYAYGRAFAPPPYCPQAPPPAVRISY